MDSSNYSDEFITPLITRFDFLRVFADLSIEISSAGNPSRVQTGPHRDIPRRHIPAERKPTKEIADWGKVTLVSDISYLFSAGTIGAHRRARDNTLRTIPHSLDDGFYSQQSKS